MVQLRRHWFTDASKVQWSRLEELLAACRPGDVLEPAQLRSAAGLTRECAVRVIYEVCRSGQGRIERRVFHACAEHPADVIGADDDLRAPWRCQECEELVQDLSELSLEIRAVIT